MEKVTGAAGGTTQNTSLGWLVGLLIIAGLGVAYYFLRDHFLKNWI